MSESWIVQNLLAIIADLSDESTLENISLDAAEGYKWRIELEVEHWTIQTDILLSLWPRHTLQ